MAEQSDTSRTSVHWDDEGLEDYGDDLYVDQLAYYEDEELPVTEDASGSTAGSTESRSSHEVPVPSSQITKRSTREGEGQKRRSAASQKRSGSRERSRLSSASAASSESAPRRYSIAELVATLGNEQGTSELSPEMERRVLDFRLAQSKRREEHGQQKRWGIFGMYAHLADVRTDLEWSEDAAWRRGHGRPYLSWSDFDDARQKGFNRPWFTYFIVVLCTIMLIVEFGLNDWQVEPLSVNPLIGPSAQAMVDAGARDTPLIVEGGQWFRIFSPLFLHAGIIHYVINMLALWFIGGAVEQTHGIINAMVLFFIPGIGGNILSAVFLPQQISVGASGGIFGLIGGCISDIVMNWKLLFIKNGEEDTQTRRRNIIAIVWLIIDIVVNLLIGLTPYVDNFSHLGGLVYGILCGFSTIEPLPVGFFGVEATTFQKIRTIGVRFGGLILTVILIVVTSAVLATMDVSKTPCNNCRYISCVPFPFRKENKWWYCDDCDYVAATLYRESEDAIEYSTIDLTCPNGEIEEIAIADQNQTDKEVIRRELPSYCREFCEQVTV